MESVEGDFEEEEFYDVALQFIEEQFEEYIENEDAYMERYFQSLIPDEPDYDRYYDD
jgi:hypothetical protein